MEMDRASLLSHLPRVGGSLRAAALITALAAAMAPACAHRAGGPPRPCSWSNDRVPTRLEIEQLAGEPSDVRALTHLSVDGFLDAYFRVFDHHQEDMATSRWAWLALPDAGLVLDNLDPVTQTFFDAMDREAAWGERGSIDRAGIALATTSLRAMPTARPLIGPPGRPGQGFPFDLLQNSLVNANEPLWLSHRSSSGEWTFVFTSYASGWIKSRDVGTLSASQALAWRQLAPVACLVDGHSVRDRHGHFLFATRIGMVLPLVGRTADHFSVLTAVPSPSRGDAVMEAVSLPAELAVPVPLLPTVENLSLVAERLLGSPYGWGGLHGHRDCSATIRDFFMPFGLWLPRNSREQALAGQTITLENLDPATKQRRIVERGVPFATLLYKPGHILLYIGQSSGVPFALHAVWDLTTRRAGRPPKRDHIGRTVISPLCPTDAEGSSLLDGLESMHLLGASALR